MTDSPISSNINFATNRKTLPREVGINWVWIGDRQPRHEIIRVNHYHVRSMEDWVERYRRGQCNDPARDHTMDFLYNSRIFRERDHTEIYDPTILRFAGRLKAML